MKVYDLTISQLTEALRAGTKGHAPGEAAVELLHQHGVWLARHDLRPFVEYIDEPAQTGGVPMAFINWGRVVAALDGVDGAHLAGAASDCDLLRIAASMSGAVPVSLREVLGGFGAHTIGLVAEACIAANGTEGATVTVPAPPRPMP